jgi:hypothetical protein
MKFEIEKNAFCLIHEIMRDYNFRVAFIAMKCLNIRCSVVFCCILYVFLQFSIINGVNCILLCLLNFYEYYTLLIH